MDFSYVDAATINLDSLDHVGGYMQFRYADNSAAFARNLSFPKLRAVDGAVLMHQLSYLEQLHAPRLAAGQGQRCDLRRLQPQRRVSLLLELELACRRAPRPSDAAPQPAASAVPDYQRRRGRRRRRSERRD